MDELPTTQCFVWQKKYPWVDIKLEWSKKHNYILRFEVYSCKLLIFRASTCLDPSAVFSNVAAKNCFITSTNNLFIATQKDFLLIVFSFTSDNCHLLTVTLCSWLICPTLYSVGNIRSVVIWLLVRDRKLQADDRLHAIIMDLFRCCFDSVTDTFAATINLLYDYAAIQDKWKHLCLCGAVLVNWILLTCAWRF